MVNERWNDSITYEFVKLYMKHECLWNTVHPGYKIKHRRFKAYADLISKFKEITNISLTRAEVTNKIKNLRTTYGSIVIKTLQYSRPDCEYKSNLKWFDEMDRCLKTVPGHRYAVMYGQDIPELHSTHQNWIDNGLQQNSYGEINPDPPPVTPQHSDVEFEIKQGDSVIKIEVLQSSQQCLTTHNPSQSSTENVIKEDDYEIYGRFLASQLRTMKLEKALRIQLQIQNLLIESRLLELRAK